MIYIYHIYCSQMLLDVECRLLLDGSNLERCILKAPHLMFCSLPQGFILDETPRDVQDSHLTPPARL